MKRLLASLVTVALLTPTAAQGAPRQRASLGEIEREVMCLVCGTTLNVSDSPQADRERAFIRRLIARGETKAQIEDALVAQYGRAVLATPSDSGFDLAAWLVPGLAVVLAAAGIAFAVVRWRRGRPARATGRAESSGAAQAPGGADGARLRSDLERYEL